MTRAESTECGKERTGRNHRVKPIISPALTNRLNYGFLGGSSPLLAPLAPPDLSFPFNEPLVQPNEAPGMGSNGGGGGKPASWEFHATGPRNLSNPSWKDFISSTWTDPNYRRVAVSCFVQAAYLLELDRQENKTGENAIAPNWWKPFKYKLVRPLIDSRDGSVYGALLEWDHFAALSDFIVLRPNGAPKAVLALRGTVLKQLTVARDLEDDFRFFAQESLRGSVRFTGALEVLKSAIDKHGSNNVCIAGHSLGGGFAMQIGKTLAKDGVFVECHLFNPPSVSLGMGLRKLQEKANKALKRYIGGNSSNAAEISRPREEGEVVCEIGEEKLIKEVNRWVPNLYINNCDYICCFYMDRSRVDTVTAEKAHAKVFVIEKGPQKFLKAHALQQWWSDDSELHLAMHESKLMYRHLKSLYVKES